MDGTLSEKQERALIERSLAGDAAAFDELVRSHGDRIFQLTRHVCSALPAEADDVYQETFLAAFRKLARFRSDARFGTWLHRIAANLCWMRHRSRRRDPTVPLGEPSPEVESGSLEVPDGAPSPEEAARREELRATVMRALGALPTEYRLVLTLRDVEGLSTQETAKALNLSAAAVKSRLHRGRALLREGFDRALGS